MTFKGRDLVLTSFGIQSGVSEQATLVTRAVYLDSEGKEHGYTDLEVDTQALPLALRLKLREMRDEIEKHIRSLHFEGEEDEPANKPEDGPPGGGIAERFQGGDDSESFEQGGG